MSKNFILTRTKLQKTHIWKKSYKIAVRFFTKLTMFVLSIFKCPVVLVHSGKTRILQHLMPQHTWPYWSSCNCCQLNWRQTSPLPILIRHQNQVTPIFSLSLWRCRESNPSLTYFPDNINNTCLWEQLGSNQWPLACKASALNQLSYAPIKYIKELSLVLEVGLEPTYTNYAVNDCV